ncbi:MAG TPA: glutamate mutase L, partial [Anaerolineales bacterium]|nr:glutamate mutase L [Anaerolineales bacterium]
MTKTKAFVDDYEEMDELSASQDGAAITQETHPGVEFRSGSLLTVDIGSVHTRAALFDIVEGRARFLAAGRSQTTAAAPLLDASEGMRFAMEQVEQISGRILIGQDGRPLIPTTQRGQGVDYMASTLSVGPPLKTVVVGLLDKVSLASVTNLAKTSYTDVVASISLNKAQKPEEYIDVIQRVMPDLIMIAGGTDSGASQSVLRLVNMIGMALYLMPKENRPDILFAGNPALAKQVQRFIKPLANIQLAPNIRPALAVERLGPAQSILTETFKGIHIGRVAGIGDLSNWSSGNLIPTANALGRVTRFFSKIIPNPDKVGVLGVDVGASSTTIAGSFDSDLRLRVFTKYGMGSGLKGILENSQLEDVTKWIPGEVHP